MPRLAKGQEVGHHVPGEQVPEDVPHEQGRPGVPNLRDIAQSGHERCPFRLRFVETGRKTGKADGLHGGTEPGRGGKGDRMPRRRECAGQRNQRMEMTGPGECGEQDAHGGPFWNGTSNPFQKSLDERSTGCLVCCAAR